MDLPFWLPQICIFRACDLTPDLKTRYGSKKPIDLGIDAYKLFLSFLFQLIRTGSPFPVSHLASWLILALLRKINTLSSFVSNHKKWIAFERPFT
jgi:hypothetical protein